MVSLIGSYGLLGHDLFRRVREMSEEVTFADPRVHCTGPFIRCLALGTAIDAAVPKAEMQTVYVSTFTVLFEIRLNSL